MKSATGSINDYLLRRKLGENGVNRQGTGGTEKYKQIYLSTLKKRPR